MTMIRSFLVLACLVMASGLGATSAVAFQGGESPGRTVNVELIVDASGSMAAETNTGELRIDSAKRVLTEVINAIPEAEGVNVGLRVYGHLGDNTDEGRAESCVSSDLLAPIDGVDKPALLAQVDTLQPVGWTPIGYALEQASADFTQPASDDVVNAIVMVTDGLETCDADPVAIAGELRASDAAITTHVIGFGTTPEEQTILSGIAEAGEGELLGSDNTGQLQAALFEVLEELEVVEETGTGESRESPLGVGRIGTIGDYEVSVLSVEPNADETVIIENEFNEPPADGNQFFIARVAATYVGSATGTPWLDLSFKSVGGQSTSYELFNNTCGVYPDDPTTYGELFEGGSAEFNICWQIASADQDSLVMYIEPNSFDQDAEQLWFSLGNPIENAVDPDSTPLTTETPTEVPPPTETAMESDSAGATTPRESSRDNPLPVSQVGIIGDYEVSVLSVEPNADETVMVENEFNEPPAPGNQFLIARIAVTYIGSGTGTPWLDLNFKSVGDQSTSYELFNNTCGVYPDDATTFGELFEGGTAEFNVCWQIASADQDSLVMYIEPNTFDTDAEQVWLSLQP